MMQWLMIGLAAGLATALLFASVASGSALAVPLFYLSPLPILIAAMGWSPWAALIAALLAAAGLAAAFGGLFAISFLVGVGLPAWWLGYLALLARPVAGAADEAAGIEWYPVGHLVFWAALLSAGIVIAAIFSLGSDLDTFRATLRSGLERMFDSPVSADSERQARILDVMATALPPAAAVLTSLVSICNLWLAERIVKVSGRLRRPPSDLTEMHFPAYALALSAVALVCSFFGGMIGLSAGVLSASLLIAYAILGLAVLHAITRGMRGRPFTLGSIYAAIVILGWPVLMMSLLGVADSALDLRGRASRRRGPTHPRT